MKTRYRVAVAVVTLLALTAETSADPLPLPTPHIVLKSGPGVLHGPDGHDYVIPTDSHILSPDGWTPLDLEFKRLQDQETRLQAENQSLRKSANEFPWTPILIGAGIGLITGIYVTTKLI